MSWQTSITWGHLFWWSGGRGRESGERVFWIGQKRSILFSVPIYVQSCIFTVPTPFHRLLNKEAHNKPLLLIKPTQLRPVGCGGYSKTYNHGTRKDAYSMKPLFCYSQMPIIQAKQETACVTGKLIDTFGQLTQ